MEILDDRSVIYQLEVYKKWYEEQQEEIERLNNIINEFEKEIKEEIDRLEKVALENKNNKEEFNTLILLRGKTMDILSELKELKEGK